MIKFFRKIRQKLLSENKFKSYLLYALGEIFLVVVGILIALSINNWNGKQKKKVAEQVLLKALLQEFEDNLEILDNTVQLNTRIFETCIKIGEITGPEVPKLDEKQISEYFLGAFKYESNYIPNNGILTEANNSGKLSLIRDPELRSAISAWVSQSEFVARQEAYVLELRDHTHQFFLDYGNFRRHLDVIEDALLDVKPSKFPNNDFSFIKNQQFESYMYLFIVASINLNKTFYAPLRVQTEAIIEQIKSNIK